jgi:hypothetical protein
VIADIPQNSCPITAMNSIASAPPRPSACSSTVITANDGLLSSGARFLMANVSAMISA